MPKFLSFSSGSAGNCYFLGSGSKGIVIDAGVSLRRMKKALELHGMDFSSFSSILVTHDHLDHIRNLGSYCKKLCKPVYATPTLHGALARHTFAAPYIDSCRHDLAEGVWNDIDGFQVRCFQVPHDATQTVGFAIAIDGHKFVIMTDIGRMTEEALSFAQGADTVVIESNYDMDMLMGGSYTYELKMRICKGNGHLSNDECALAIKAFWHQGLRNIFLCHLSENNNTPQLAYACAFAALSEIGVPPGAIHLEALRRRDVSPLFEL